MNTIQKFIIACTAMIALNTGFSQLPVKLSGKVSSFTGKPLTGATVVAQRTDSVIVSFSITGKDGTFELSIPRLLVGNTVIIVASAIDHYADTLQLSNTRIRYDFSLQPSTNLLSEVVVQNSDKLLKQRGDTLTYNADSLRFHEDRVIGDIIRRIPGIEITENGVIRFQGKTINRFYIDGDDFIGGNYATITNNLRNDAVSAIQILQNHQPIRNLQKIDFSDEPALNLVIKEDFKIRWMNDGTAGLGVPSLYFLNHNLSFLGKKNKSFNNFKLNNTGEDLYPEIVMQNSYAVYAIGNSQAIPNSIPSPDLRSNRYLQNRSALTNVNLGHNFNETTSLRTNIRIFNINRNQIYEATNLYFFPNDTIHYFLNQSMTASNCTIGAELILQHNGSKSFLTNKLSLYRGANATNANIQATDYPFISQHLRTTSSSISNEFSLITPISKKLLIQFNSAIASLTIPQDLTVSPGIKKDYFNQGIPYESLLEQSNTSNFITKNIIGLRIPGNVSQAYNFRWEMEDKQLTSMLYTTLSAYPSPVSDSFRNNLPWSTQTTSAEAQYAYIKNGIQVDLIIPFSQKTISYTLNDTIAPNNSIFHLLEPSVRLKIPIWRESFIALNSGLSYTTGNILDVFQGFILTSFRDIYANSGSLPFSKNFKTEFSIHTSKVPSLLFYGLGLSYITSHANYATSYEINEQLTQKVYYPISNQVYYMAVTGYISKYILPFKTTLSLKVNGQITKDWQFQNGNLLRFAHNTTSITYSANTKLSNFSTMEWSGEIRFSKSENIDGSTLSEHPVIKTQANLQRATLNLKARRSLSFRMTGEYYNYTIPGLQKTHSIFLDLAAFLDIGKSRSRIELIAQNLLDQRMFNAFVNAANQRSSQSFDLRPRSLLLRFSYYF